MEHLSGKPQLGMIYYPEQWPEERWQTDARMMSEAGITTVRLAEFAWHKFEPVEGRYELAWLERALEILARYRINAILCTPTPTYPAWLHRKYPDIHQVKSDGRVKEFGQRQDACKNHPGYREHALRITETVTKHFGDHPNVVAWQTDNELGCHGTARCYCANCEREFQAWLSRRFGGDIAKLNAAWGTEFWSQEYNDFSEISPPRDTADRFGTGGQNPGLSLDFFRFSSDVQIEFNRELATIIRRNSPARPVTHNLMGGYTHIDYFRLARDLDVVSWDNYPFFQPQTPHRMPAALPHDLMRGLKGKNVWVMEQAAGPGGWDRFFPTPDPGRMGLWVLQAIARGADYVSFFRWRSARYGTEQFWHGILPHHGVPDRRHEELRSLSAQIERMASELEGSEVTAEVAVIYDYDSLWALEIQPQTMAGVAYHEIAGDYVQALSRLGVTADIVPAGADLSGYRAVIAPSQYVTPPGFAAKLRDYVKAGGILLIGARSAVKDEENAIHEEELPAGLRELAGCRVVDYDAFSYLAKERVEVVTADGTRHAARHLAELLEPSEGAESLLTYEGRYYTKRCAAVRKAFEGGASYYLGTFLDAEGLKSFLQGVLRDASVPFVDDLDSSVETTVRRKGEATYRFYLNHETSPKTVPAVRKGRDLLSGREVGGQFVLDPLGVAVVKEA